MSDLTDFLLARIAEDEAVAREAIPGTYSPNADDDGSWQMIEVDHEGIWPEPLSKPTSEWGHLASEPWAVHVERHDPARVLAECEVKRRIVERAQRASQAFAQSINPTTSGVAMTLDLVLADLALPYADHEDYRQEWRP